MRTRKYSSLADLVCDHLQILHPPERLTVSQSAAKYRLLNTPGGQRGAYNLDMTPYLEEPMDMQASRSREVVVFVGPAQTGKTEGLLLNSVAHWVLADPMDMIIYSPTKGAARDFSIRRIDRMHRDSPKIGEQLSARKDSDNKFDKIYRTGAILTLSHPSVTEFAGKPIPKVYLTDYDRMPDDIDGEGSPFDLARKRTTTFGSFAMTVAESTPSRPVINPKAWIPANNHQAPPCDGILGLYNRGDMRRWYWECPRCREYFMGEFAHLSYPDEGTNAQRSAAVVMICPRCSGVIRPGERFDMNLTGVWLASGQRLAKHPLYGHVIEGDRNTGSIASYWLKGVAAAFITWQQLVFSYLEAKDILDRTGSDSELITWTNTNNGEPFIPKIDDVARNPATLKGRAEGVGIRGEEKVVPENVRFLIACVDVQKNGFVVQVHGISPGEPFDMTVVDRFTILKSKRLDADGEREWLKPHAYQEDWEAIYDQVMTKTYLLDDGSERRMMVYYTCCDSGGKEGVTGNAYGFYRWLGQNRKREKFILVKGEPMPHAPRAKVNFPDASRKDKLSSARGDVPVLMLNSNILKDMLANRLECVTEGKGLYRLPNWLEDWFFKELCAEVRDEKGWTNPPHTRNEAWDLSYYCIGVCVSEFMRIESFDWSKPPAFARPWDENPYITKPNMTTRYQEERQDSDVDLSKLGAMLG